MNYISGLPNEVTHQTFREKTRPGIYYHYTSLSTLWAVLDNECLRATQACFSNDSEEVAKGKRVIAEIYNDKDNLARPIIDNNNKMLFGETEENIDCYIICFCGEDDKLSQWRAYCRNDGVSIGFAFDGTEPLYYFADQPYNIQTGHAAELYPVWYLDENNALHSSAGEHIKTTAALQADILEQLDKIEELSDEHHKEDFLLSAIPLIKHLQKLYRKLMTKGRVERIEAEKQAKGLSTKTVRNINQVTSSAMDFAVAQKIISVNPCKAVALPKVEHKEMKSCCGARYLRRRQCGLLIYRPLPLAHLPVSATGGGRLAPHSC